MKNKVLFISIAIVIVMVIFFSYQKIGIDNKDDIKILKSDSWFDEFYVEEGKVFIKYEITVQNSGDKDKYINLTANMEEDKNSGLLKSAIVSGYDKKGNNRFFIPANSQKDCEVFFIGDFAGKEVKQNRNLPMIEVAVADSSTNMVSTDIKNVNLKKAAKKKNTKIYDAFKACSDYPWLSQIQFSPCTVIEKRVKEIDDVNSINQISNFKFERCNLCGQSEDIIMLVDVETKRSAFTLLMVFLSGQDNVIYSAATYNNELISYKLIDIDNDSQKELLVDNTVVSNGTWRYIDILQFSNDSDMIYLFEKSVNSFQHELSYYFSSDVPKKFILEDVKVNGKKKMKTEKKTYCYRDKKYILE